MKITGDPQFSMSGVEQAIWCAVFAAELVKSRDADGKHPVDAAAATADFAVADLARYRRAQEAELERLTRPAAKGKAA